MAVARKLLRLRRRACVQRPMRSPASTKFSSSTAADASAGTRPDGGAPAGTGAASAGAVASAGVVRSAGAAGACRADRERIGRVSVRRSVICLEVDREAPGQEVVGQAAAVPEPVGRAAAVAAVAVAAAGDPALTSVFQLVAVR